jgi:hypothetical protein
MWKRRSESLHRTWLMLHRKADERRTQDERARFWAEVRKGQQEADLAFRN